MGFKLSFYFLDFPKSKCGRKYNPTPNIKKRKALQRVNSNERINCYMPKTSLLGINLIKYYPHAQVPHFVQVMLSCLRITVPELFNIFRINILQRSFYVTPKHFYAHRALPLNFLGGLVRSPASGWTTHLSSTKLKENIKKLHLC